MTTWTNKSSVTTHYTNVDNSTIYGTRTNFNQSGVSFNQLGVKFNNWFTSYENRNVIYTDVVDPNYQWNYDLNHNIGMSEIGRPIGLLLVLTKETTEFRADWNNVDQHTTYWNNI